MTSCVLKQINLPLVGCPAEPRPELTGGVFETRLAKVRKRMRERGLDGLGIKLADEILPFSNFPAMMIPFFLDSRITLARC